MAKSHDFYLFLIIMSVFRHDSYEIIIDKHLMKSNKKTQDSLNLDSKNSDPWNESKELLKQQKHREDESLLMRRQHPTLGWMVRPDISPLI